MRQSFSRNQKLTNQTVQCSSALYNAAPFFLNLASASLYSFAFRQSSAIRFNARAGASAVLSSVPWPTGDVMPSATVRRARSLAPSVSSNSFCAFLAISWYRSYTHLWTASPCARHALGFSSLFLQARNCGRVSAVREGAQFYATQRGVCVGSAVCTVQSGVRSAVWRERSASARRGVRGAERQAERVGVRNFRGCRTHTSKFSSKHLFPISRPAAYSSVASGGRDLGPISDMVGGAAPARSRRKTREAFFDLISDRRLQPDPSLQSRSSHTVAAPHARDSGPCGRLPTLSNTPANTRAPLGSSTDLTPSWRPENCGSQLCCTARDLAV